ncbi:MAG: hypothetical protein HRU15_01000 [Planctomycetes bacterium]|nr:hypothetical protein [Planctomycetota bacterium]
MRLFTVFLMVCVMSLVTACGGNSDDQNVFNGLSVVNTSALATPIRYIGGSQTFDVTVYPGLDVDSATFTLSGPGIATSVMIPSLSGQTYTIVFNLPANSSQNGIAINYNVQVQFFNADGDVIYDRDHRITVPAMSLPPNPPNIP